MRPLRSSQESLGAHSTELLTSKQLLTAQQPNSPTARLTDWLAGYPVEASGLRPLMRFSAVSAHEWLLCERASEKIIGRSGSTASGSSLLVAPIESHDADQEALQLAGSLMQERTNLITILLNAPLLRWLLSVAKS